MHCCWNLFGHGFLAYIRDVWRLLQVPYLRHHLCEIHEMLEACVEMSLLPKAAYAPEVGVVDVRIHSEEPLEHGAHNIHEVWRESHAVLL